MYYVYINSMALVNADRLLTEATPYAYAAPAAMTLTVASITATNFVLSTSTVTGANQFMVYINGNLVYTSATGLTSLSSVTVTPGVAGPWAVNVYAYNSGYALIATGYFTNTQFRVKATSTTVPAYDTMSGIAITNLGSVTAVTDPLSSGRGYVFSFNGSGTAGLTLPNMYTPPTSTRTFWVYTTTPTYGNGICIGSQLWGILFGGTPNIYVTLNGQNTGAGLYEWYYTPAISTSAWTFIAITTTGTTSSYYVNGTLVSVQLLGGASNGTNTTSVPFTYAGESGMVGLGVAPGNTGNFKGYLDDFRQYNYVLTPTQITAVMNLTM
jgi:hypothetical protein